MALRQLTLWLQQSQVQPLLGKRFRQQTAHGQARQRQHLPTNGLEVLALLSGAQHQILMCWLPLMLATLFFAK
jgi:hypothetical protein